MSRLDTTAPAITRRLMQASAASDLNAARRLDAKIDLSPEGVSRRLRECSELLELCRRLRALP
jgi:hypothetical protein